MCSNLILLLFSVLKLRFTTRTFVPAADKTAFSLVEAFSLPVIRSSSFPL